MYKLPFSVQVVIFARTGETWEYLLLKRIESCGGFWQSVTGSLEEGESHVEAAIREVGEETGFKIESDALLDLKLKNRFAIAPQWLHRYAPGVAYNEEVCFALPHEKSEPILDALEHDDCRWVGYSEAQSMLYWDSNVKALKRAEEIIRYSNTPEAARIE